MGSLSVLLEQESCARGFLLDNESINPERAFAIVRDMPYARASSREPEAIIKDWRGTCSGKHYLLAGVFREMGLDSKVLMCTHQFTENNTRHFPAELRAIVKANPVPDVHTYLLVGLGQGWTRVDATWPTSSEPLGMTVNRVFHPGTDMALACEPIDTFEVPQGQDPQVFKEDLIAKFCGASSQSRDDFINGMSDWLRENT